MLGDVQPISSPMMNKMLGFCGCCASAGRKPPHNVTTAVAAAITLKSNLCFTNSSSANRCCQTTESFRPFGDHKSAFDFEILTRAVSIGLRGHIEWKVSAIGAAF